MIHIDFETRSHCDLKTAGPHRYAQDPSTEIMCVSWAVDDQDPRIWFPSIHTDENALASISLVSFFHISREFAAFNASFESSIWSEIMVKKHGAPPIVPERWHCTASQAYAVTLPRRMDAVAQALEIEQQKDKEGAALMRKMCIIKSGSMPEIDPDELRRLGEYCKQDVIVEREIARRLPPLSEREQKIYVVDQKINKRGIEIDIPLVENAVRMVAVAVKDANAELSQITEGAVRTVGQTAVIKAFAESRGAVMDDCGKGTLSDLLKTPDLDPLTREVFKLRLGANRAAVKKYPALLKAVCTDGRARDHLMYCGAGRTRRWSGQRVQTQNIARGYKKPHDIGAACEVLRHEDPEMATALFGKPMVMLAGTVRSMLKAREGSRLVTVDFSGIEARVLAAVTDNRAMLEDYARKRDPYITMAAAIYNVPYSEVTEEQRFFGKQAVLGLGYGMGANKFQETCAGYGQEIEFDFADKVVKLYRAKNAVVIEFWKQIEADVLEVLMHKHGIGRQFYGLRWDSCLDALVMTLPNGSERWYVDARIELREKFGKTQPSITYMGTHSKTGKWCRLESYGGKLAENYTQSTARELQADALLAVDAAGWSTVLHAHDEIVCEVPEGEGSVDQLIEYMTTASTWASQWPIGADGWEGPRYRK